MTCLIVKICSSNFWVWLVIVTARKCLEWAGARHSTRSLVKGSYLKWIILSSQQHKHVLFCCFTAVLRTVAAEVESRAKQRVLARPNEWLPPTPVIIHHDLNLPPKPLPDWSQFRCSALMLSVVRENCLYLSPVQGSQIWCAMLTVQIGTRET